MRTSLLAALLILTALAPATAPAQTGPAAELAKTKVQAVIRAQIGSFAADDGPAAYRHAAPSIQAQFPSIDAFMTMVRTQYGAVYRARNIRFGRFAMRRGRALQEVSMTGPRGQPWTALYILERQSDGSWRIAGVVLKRASTI